MPCDTISVVTVELGKLNRDTLRRALAALGAEYIQESNGAWAWYRNGRPESLTAAGQLTCRDNAAAVEIRRGYAAQLVRDQAKRAGWKVQERGGKILLQKGY